MDNNNKNLALPVSIIIAALIIGGTIFYASKNNSLKTINKKNTPDTEKTIDNKKTEGPKEISENDHILGNPEADLTMFLFTDLECPFCKNFHYTIKQMMEEYGKEGKIKVVFRQFPLDALHSKARKEAEATECVANIGGNEKFWEYVDKIFSVTPSNNGLDLEQLPKLAKEIGIDENKFNECLNSGKFANKVQADYEDAIKSGGQGTPYFIIIDKNGNKTSMAGALPYSQLKIIIAQILSGNNNPSNP